MKKLEVLLVIPFTKYLILFSRRFSNEEEKEANKAKLFDSVPLFLTRMANFIENNPSKSGYLVGSEVFNTPSSITSNDVSRIDICLHVLFSSIPQLTWADVCLARYFEVLKDSEPNVALTHPKIQEHQGKVWSQPRIKAYLIKQGRLS